LTELLRYPKLLPKGSERRKNAVRWLSGLPTIANNVEDETIMPVHMAKPNTHDPYFPESWLQAYRSAEKVSVAMKYLMGRGVALETIIRMDIRFDPYSDRVCFPIRDYTGQLRGMQGRGIRPDAKPKYLFYTYEQQSCGREVLLGEDMVDPTRPVLLVEGAFDMAKLMPSTKQVLVLWGASVNAQRIERLKKFPKIYTLLDNDAAGDNARKALKQSTLPVTNLKVPEQYKDVGEMPDPALHQYAELVDSYASII
jgi:5S rRNA maturation endonuclease (ribonuclease M5)